MFYVIWYTKDAVIRGPFSLLPHSFLPCETEGEKAHSLHPEIGCLANSEEGFREECPFRTKQEVISFGSGSPETDY